MKTKHGRLIPIYLIVVSLIALALGFSEGVLANYYKDAYDITATQRGFIEIPREIPGIISLFIIAGLARFGDIKIAIVSQLVAMVGIIVLAFYTPGFYTMTALIFIFSMGVHLYLPLQDSLALSIMSTAGEENIGTNIGKVKGISTGFSLVASVIVFLGFSTGIFSFETQVKSIFLLSALCFFFAILLLIALVKSAKGSNIVRPKLVFRKAYKYYYILAIMNGVQKQIVLVYAPWVIIELLGKGADTMSLLLMFSSICGMFFLPLLGKMLDKFGIKKMLYVDALSFIIVYLAFAYMSYNFYTGNFKKAGIAVLVTFIIFIVDRMSSQMSMIRTVYLNKIAKDRSEVLSTISIGISLDHVVAIACSYASGVIWTNYGPHYIFIFAASLSLINLVVAKLVKVETA